MSDFHPTYLRLLQSMLQAEGCDADAIVRQAGLDPEQLRSGQQFIDSPHMLALLAAAVRVTRKPWLGLEFGLLAQVFMHGPLGYAAAASATLGEALALLPRFSGLRTAALRVQLKTHQRDSELILIEVADLGASRIVVLEAMLTIIARLLVTLSGRPCDQAQLFLPWPKPAWASKYAECFGGSCQFDAERLVLRLPNALLEAPCLTADPEAYAKACEECERQLGAPPSARPVAQGLRSRLLRCDGGYPTLAQVAEEQSTSARTLIRKLKAEGSSYQDLLDEVRCERARWFLLHTDMPVDTIAERLGMQNSSNFSRSFRRWQGVTPAQFRAGR
ncbi:AraC family transcriptional regulator [Oxalobacteraceae bacterium]|nr:AraC family transcriptional regulator [Oxalobacteraceae bacterium]